MHIYDTTEAAINKMIDATIEDTGTEAIEDYGDSILPEDWDPANYVFVSPEDQAAEWSEEDMDRMAAEHEEEMAARAEMESGALRKFSNGDWS